MEGDDLQTLPTAVLDSLPTSVAIVDTDGDIVWTDRSWREFSATNARADPDDVAKVTVADDGPGIPDASNDSVFGRGEKGLDSEGTGIGLYLIRELVEGYGGGVAVSDNDPRGTVVTVDLPRADAGRCSSTDESEGKA